MPIEMLNGADATARIRSSARDGWKVLGVDGFRLMPEGYVASLDLILDLSSSGLTAEAAEAEALGFISKHAAADVMFEVVTDTHNGT